MARAKRIRRIRPNKGLRGNARKVVAIRLEELISWQRALEDPALVTELHDMRIAAKRLRYALEIFEVCFPTKDVLRDLTDMQEDLGSIHDQDVLIEILRARLRALDQAAEHEAIEITRSEGTVISKNKRLQQLLSGQPGGRTRLGLLGLIAGKVVEREQRYHAFQARWRGDPLNAFCNQVLEVTGLDTSKEGPAVAPAIAAATPADAG